MNKIEAKNQIREKTLYWIARAREIYGHDFKAIIKFDLKGRSAGQYRKRDGVCEIRFNLTALDIEGGFEHLLNQTSPHEVAHLVQRNHPDWPKDRKVNTSHGHYWRGVMRAFGVEAHRCHDLPLPKSRAQARHVYVCGCREYDLSTTRHNKIQSGKSRYTCNHCRVVLKRKVVAVYSVEY